MTLSSNYSHPLAVQTRQGRRRTLVGVAHGTFPNAAAIDDNGYLTALAGPNATTITPTLDGALAVLGVGVPDFTRNVVVTVTHASSVVAENGVITGTDINDKVITEAWSVTATGTSKVFTGLKAFKRVTSVTIVSASNATTNTNIIGTGKKFGLSAKCSSVVPVAEEEDGAAPTAGVIVKASVVAADDKLGTYAPNSAPNAALDFDIWYLSDDPHLSDT